MTNDARVRRRLAAILAADVVGYSGLMEADEAGTLERLFALRTRFLEPRIAHYEGRIANTAGDGMVVEFQSIASAVYCAASIQAQLSDWPNFGEPLELRIGIHIGEVVVRDGDLFGDCVNIAARLEQTSDPGGILISDIAHGQLGGDERESFDAVGPLALKNISREISAWRWRKPSDDPARDDPEKLDGAWYDNVSVIFFDIAGFTEWGDATSAAELVEFLARVFKTMDHAAARHGVKKIQTFGDSYLAVVGLPDGRDDHAQCAARYALAVRDEVAGIIGPMGTPVEVHIGMHCGPLIAGVVGRDKRPYGVWGETVNLAVRLEGSGLPETVRISDPFRQALAGDFHVDGPYEVQLTANIEATCWGLVSEKSAEAGER